MNQSNLAAVPQENVISPATSVPGRSSIALRAPLCANKPNGCDRCASSFANMLSIICEVKKFRIHFSSDFVKLIDAIRIIDRFDLPSDRRS